MKLQLYYPVLPWTTFQGFGECHPSVCDIYKNQLGLLGHNGIDARAVHGQVVRAAHDGEVTFAGEDGSAGLGVVIRTTEKLEYGNETAYYKTIYWHLKKGSIKVTPGQRVKVGDVIAEADNTGLSTGDHLHFGLKPVYQGEKPWEWWNSEQNNGYKGAIDPAPFLIGKYAEDAYILPKASDEIAVFAAKMEAQGNTTASKTLFALAAFLRASWF